MTYHQRLSFFFIIDSFIVFTAFFMSWFLVNEKNIFLTSPLIITLFSILLGHHFFAIRFKLYKKVWEYASVGELLITFKIAFYSMFFALIIQGIFLKEINFRILIVTWILHMFLIGGSRFIWRVYRDQIINKPRVKLRTLIIGAGSAGTMVARQLLNNHDHDLLPVAFIDDNPRKYQLDILGLPIVGGIKEIQRVVKNYSINNIIISIPSLSRKELNTIFQECMKTNVETKILPLLEDLVKGKVAVTQLREVQVEDLLGRAPIDIDIDSISDYLTNKVVLVTGAGGSIGSEISRQTLRFNPRKLILLGHGENSIYKIEWELRESLGDRDIEIITEITDIKDKRKVVTVMSMFKPDVVYHAAAHKHVSFMEKNPEEAVKNNMIGTKNVALAAHWSNVRSFVMISTDKAVHPTSVMGASKRLAEMIVQDMNKNSQTKFVAVRFGNVLGSRGSVIPLFKKQIKKGGPVTITHPDMMRYFMTIPEASRLVIQAGALANGGEIFVLDMGDPVKIVDLAKNLIKLSGYSVDEIGLKFIGVRPGEKLFEELLLDHEVHEQQLYPKIYIGKTTETYISEIERIIDHHTDLSRETLKKELLMLANKDVIEHPESVVTV